MRIAVTGSIATDHLMTFPGKFADQLVADKLHKVALSFLVDGLQIRRGGVAANIAFGLACLGLRPLLVGSAGPDFAEYRGWLDRHGVDTSGVRESTLHHTARFVATTDQVGNQIASFYPGAMSEDIQIQLGPLADGCDLVLIGASDPEAMTRTKAVFPNLAYHRDPYESLAGADAALVCTEWQQFRELDWERAGRLMARRLVIDGRNLYSPKKMRDLGFDYYSFGQK